MKRNRNAVILACVLALVPSITFANAGSGLIWTYMFHLVFFNTIIGVGESVLLCLMFRTILPRFLLAMLATNYASAYVGKWFIESPYCVNFTGDSPDGHNVYHFQCLRRRRYHGNEYNARTKHPYRLPALIC